MWERFSDDLKYVVAHALKLGVDSGHGVVDIRCLLLAIGEQPASRAMRVLGRLGIPPIPMNYGPDDADRVAILPPTLSSPARRILEGAMGDADALNHPTIDSGHLLLSLSRASTLDDEADYAVATFLKTLPDRAGLLAEIDRLPRECN